MLVLRTYNIVDNSLLFLVNYRILDIFLFGHFEREGILCWTFFLVGLFFGFGHFLTARERERNERETRERRGDEEIYLDIFLGPDFF